MGEGCTRNRPPPQSVWSSTWRHTTMEWHGGQTSHRRKRREGFWPLCEAEVQRPAELQNFKGSAQSWPPASDASRSNKNDHHYFFDLCLTCLVGGYSSANDRARIDQLLRKLKRFG